MAHNVLESLLLRPITVIVELESHIAVISQVKRLFFYHIYVRSSFITVNAKLKYPNFMWNEIMHTLLVLASELFLSNLENAPNGRKFEENNHWIWINVCDIPRFINC